MDPERPSIITRKSPEQVAHQMKQIALDDRSGNIDLSTDLGDKYYEYVEILRNIRNSQRVEIGLQMENRLDRSPKEVLLEATRYREQTGQSILFDLCFNLTDRRYEVLDYPASVEEARSEKSFFAALEKILATNPAAVYRCIAKLKLVIPTERILKAITDAGPHPGFMQNFNILSSYFSQAEQAELIGPYMYFSEYGHIVLTLFQNPDARALYTDAEVKNAVIISLQGNIYGIDPMEMIAYYITQKIITSEDLYDISVRRIEAFLPINYIPHVEEHLPDKNSLPNLFKKIYQTYESNACANQLWVLRGVSHLLPREQVFQIVQNTLLRDPFISGFDIDSCEKLLMNSDVRSLLLEALISPDLPITQIGIVAIMDSFCLTLDDKEKFIQRVIDSGNAEMALKEIRSIFRAFLSSGVTDRIALNIISHCNQTIVAERYRHYEGWDKAVTDIVVKEVIDGCTEYSAVKMWIERPSWCARLGVEFPECVVAFVDKNADTHGDIFFQHLHRFFKFVGEEQQLDLLRRFTKSNPVFALTWHSNSRDNFPITDSEIIDIARSDEDRTVFAPKSIDSFWKRFRLTVPFEKQLAHMTDGYHLYQSINQIKRMGLEYDLRQLLDSSNLSAREERKAIDVFQCFAIMKEKHPDHFSHVITCGTTVEEAQRILFNELSRLLNVELGIDLAHATAMFFQAMDTPAPFMMYVLQYLDSPKHKGLLTQIFSSISTDTFDEWKFGPSESFTTLQEQMLIPAKMDAWQYICWRSNDSTNLFENLATDSSLIAQAVRKYIEDNLLHFDVAETFDYLSGKYSKMDFGSALREETASIGSRLAQIGKSIGSLKKENSPTTTQQIGYLRAEMDQLETLRKGIIRARQIGRLTNLKPHEVASGYLSEGEDGKRKGEKIATIISSLRENADAGNYFVYDELVRMLQSQVDEEAAPQNLTVMDTADPKVWLEIGENPVSSCQSYNQGIVNECLLGYTDPNTKFLIVKNEKGNIIARSVFRILSREDGSPALHIERVYSSSMSPAVLKCVFSLAHKKALQMEMPLVISRQSQTEDGIEQDAQLASGFELRDVGYSLCSYASRAPSVYVDSAGGKSRNGIYEMSDLAEIHLIRATPIDI